MLSLTARGLATGEVAAHFDEVYVDVASGEDGAGWLAFLRKLVACGLTGVELVTSDAHCGLVEAIGATLPGAGWQRCRTLYARNLSTKVRRSAQPWVLTLLRTIFDQPDTAEVRAQFDRGRRRPDREVPYSRRTPRRRPRRPARLSADAPTSSASSPTAPR